MSDYFSKHKKVKVSAGNVFLDIEIMPVVSLTYYVVFN